MGKKKKKNNSNNKENNNDDNSNNNEAAVENMKNNDGGGDTGEKNKTDDKNNSLTVVLKVDDMHCKGCASRIVKYVRSLEGVETVKAEMASNKITIVGTVDPSEIRDKVEQKTKKKIDLVSPQPKKESKDKAPKQENKPKDKPAEDKKPKEAPVTTAVLKLGLHCQGCIEKIHKIVSKTKGVIEASIDQQKDLVTVKGTMDTKALTERLKGRLKRPVEIVPPKKEKENKESNGGDKKNKGGGGGGAERGQEGEGGGGGNIMEGNRMEYFPMGIPGSGYGYGFHVHGGGYDYGYPVGGYYQHHPVGGFQHHAPQMFSDENPNACAVM